MDPSGTINPAALNALNAAALTNPSSNNNNNNNNNNNTSTTTSTSIIKPSLRGLKRSRSPDEYSDFLAVPEADADESKPRKRGRPPKSSKTADSPQMAQPASPLAVQTPLMKSHSHSQHGTQSSPTQASPQRATPGSAGKAPVVKALPTVRDHTTDQLGPEGDEYLPREVDDAGEQKVSPNGYPLEGREYRIRTFNVPNRGEKLFMLATECARVLGYRDSYLLFNKNRSLYKIIANQPEKDNLIQQEILPYSYRSRQIAIVTARSMFRQFGSRVVVNGRRVRDDYWESKARKQGFTEEDAAGEKRPGAAKQREAAAAEASSANVMTAMPQGEIIYSNGPGLNGPPAVPPGIHPVTLAPLPMINMASDDPRVNDYSNIVRPRQEISGPAYIDRSQPSSAADIYSQANQAAEFNKSLTQQRVVRSKYYEDYWKRPHEPPTPPPQAQLPSDGDITAVAPQALQSPQRTHSMSNINPTQHGIMPPQQSAPHVMPSQYAQQQPNQHNPMQSPVRTMHQQLPSSQMHSTSPAMSMASMSQQRQQTPSYGYQGQMWPPQQPQPSPLSQGHHMPQYGQHPQQSQQSPMAPPSQLAAMSYPTMNPMGNAYPAMNRNMYQPSPSPQHFAMGPQASPAQQNSMQGWAPPSTSSGLPQEWQRYQ